jgi:hypothetical protein
VILEPEIIKRDDVYEVIKRNQLELELIDTLNEEYPIIEIPKHLICPK